MAEVPQLYKRQPSGDPGLVAVHNAQYEEKVLKMYPFPIQRNATLVLEEYAGAVAYMFEKVPKRFHTAILGRFSRKLVKRMNELTPNAR